MSSVLKINNFQTNKLIFFKESKYAPATKTSLWGLYLNYISVIEEKHNKDLWDFTQEEINEYLSAIKDKGRSTIASTNTFINKYMKWYGKYYKNNNRREFDLTIEKHINNSWYISKDCLFKMCNNMLKKTDVFSILPLIFARYGITGKELTHMRNLKWSNINYENKEIVMYGNDKELILNIPIDSDFLKWITLAKEYEVKKYKDKEIKNEYILKTQIDDDIVINYASINSRVYASCKSIGIKRISMTTLDDCCKVDYLKESTNNCYTSIDEVKEKLKRFDISTTTNATIVRLRKLYLNFIGFELFKRKPSNKYIYDYEKRNSRFVTFTN